MKTRTSMRRFAGALGVIVVMAAGCGSDDAGTIDGPTTSAAVPTTVAATPTTAVASGTATIDDLTGRWAGEFQATAPTVSNGTFTLEFGGSAPNYTGTIVLAGLCEPSCPITANVAGNAISFGSVGAQAVTYSGTISGNSMSGSYQVGTAGDGEGTWKAVRA